MKIADAGPEIKPEDVEILEAELKARLTPDYRDFLLRYNGGIPTPDTIEISGAPEMPTDVQVFFGIGRGVESSNLLWNLAFIRERCPGRHVLPIACDSGGNIFCLEIANGYAQQVVYADISISEVYFYEVAPTFEKFTDQLKPFE